MIFNVTLFLLISNKDDNDDDIYDIKFFKTTKFISLIEMKFIFKVIL